MASLNFEEVGLLIADSGAGIRAEIKGVLHYEGFREITETGRISEVKEALETNGIDLLIIDKDLPNGDVCEMINQVRHHELGINPFVVIITMAQDPSREDIMEIIDSGADDLLLKPITAGKLKDRVMHLVGDRKNFVVTSDYIGPTRRSSHRPGTEKIPELEVPNPLRAKSQDGKDIDTLQKEIDRFSEILNEQKMGRNAIQIAYLVDRLIPIYQSGKVDKAVTKPLERLHYVTEDISRRLRGTAYDHVGELCKSMVSVVSSIRKKPLEPDGKDLKLLPELAQAIKTAFTSKDEGASLARDISASVQRRAR